MRQKYAIPIGILGLLYLLLPGSLRADDFTFSFTGSDGTVTGEIIGLTNNGTPGPASDVIITSYPAAFDVDPDLQSPPIDTFQWNDIVSNSFTESAGEITEASLTAYQLYPNGSEETLLALGIGVTTFDGGELRYLGTTEVIDDQAEGGAGTITITATSVPEPGTFSLMLIGFGSLGLMMVTRKCFARGHSATLDG
jgi:PEP-CTERM motif